MIAVRWTCGMAYCTSEKSTGGHQIPLLRGEDVNDLVELVDHPV